MQGGINRRIVGIAWVITLACITVLAVLAVRIQGQRAYDQVIVDALTTAPQTAQAGMNLHDKRVIVQTFKSPTAYISHIGIALENYRGANTNSVITATLTDPKGEIIGQASTTAEALRENDITLLPVSRWLESDTQYELHLSTSGISPQRSLSAWYESKIDGFPSGTLYTVDPATGIKTTSDGNIRLQVLTQPTKIGIFLTLLRTPAALVVLASLIATYLLLLIPTTRKYILAWTDHRISLPTATISRKELLITTIIGSILAFTVTAPYYTQLDKITTMGDVQRALVYRGVARTAILEHGEQGLWDPYLCGGEPLLANMESAQLDPFFLLVLLLGENLGTRLSVTLTLIIGFLGTYVLARKYGQLTPLPALLAAGIFSFSGFQLLGFANGNYAWIPVGYIPWIIVAYLATFEKWKHGVWGALLLVFTFFGGSLHMTLYALIAAGFLGLFLAISHKSWRPIFALTWILLLFIPLVAIKLLPVAEIQAVTGEFVRPEPFIQPWSWLPRMFWSRDQLNTLQWQFEKTGENFRWIEYGSYVGFIPVALFFIGAAFSKRNKIMMASLGSSLVLLLMTFGAFPWTILSKLPFLYGPLRNPQRARVVFVLFFGMLAGYGLMMLAKHLKRTPMVSRIVLLAVVTLVLIDLGTFHNRLYPGLFNLDPPTIPHSKQFVRIPESYTDFENNGYYKVSYENYKAGQGVTDMCMPYIAQRGIFARGLGSSNDEQPYFGEAMLTRDGTIHNVSVTPNTVTVHMDPAEDGWVVLNQHYFPGWHTIPAREVKNLDGLAAARVRPDDTHITFRYRPLSYVIGAWISGIFSIAILIFLWHTARKRAVL